MAETLSPNPTPRRRQMPPMLAKFQSPTTPLLPSNDDELERSQSRAARAASIRRRSVRFSTDSPPPPFNTCLDKQQIIQLYQNCIKLARENKINQKNSWELTLIDHLSEIINVETDDNSGTNFQKASCTLEAGVRIYALRVDSMYSEVYTVLGGLTRSGVEVERGTRMDINDTIDEQSAAAPKREMEKKSSPLLTLESSFDALNIKKFDVAFVVDPLFHQTSAKFDEGGAKGLLLNNLGVQGRCHVLFASDEVPGKCDFQKDICNASDMVDISFAKEYIEEMVINMLDRNKICPTLDDIISHLDGDTQQSSALSHDQNVFQRSIADDGMVELNIDKESWSREGMFDSNGVGLDDGSFDTLEPWPLDDHEGMVGNDENHCSLDPIAKSDQKEQDPCTSNEADAFERFGFAGFLFEGLGCGCASNQNAWAGPEHWKYRPFKEMSSGASCLVSSTKKPKNNEIAESDIEFVKSLDVKLPDIFAPPRHPKSLLLPANRLPCSNRLPEDCHYRPEDLVKLFLLPNVTCLGPLGKGKQRAFSESYSQGPSNDFDGQSYPWDNDDMFGSRDGDGTRSDVEDGDTVVSQHQQVNKIEDRYAKSAKEVDVHVLKEALWNHIQGSLEAPKTEVYEEFISFRHVLATLPHGFQAMSPGKITPHICFICLLHLANEHGLQIEGSADLDDLTIHLQAQPAAPVP
ncbi:hypothetical protein Dimus_019159 [Dionaea muscipula]